MAGTIEAKFDLTGAIIAFESGELDHDGEMELMQNLLDSGMYLHLQGSYGRAVQRALDAGDISPTPSGDYDCKKCRTPQAICEECQRCVHCDRHTTACELEGEYETVKHFAQSNPTNDAISLAELVSAKLGIELTVQQAADIYAATV